MKFVIFFEAAEKTDGEVNDFKQGEKSGLLGGGEPRERGGSLRYYSV